MSRLERTDDAAYQASGVPAEPAAASGATVAEPQTHEPRPETRPAPPRMFTRGALLCGLIAALVALAWSIVTPPFQVPDEPIHFAYVQHIAETGTAPETGPRPPLSSELNQALGGSRFSLVIGKADGRPPWPGAAEQTLRANLDAGAPADDGGGPSSASTQPPLYYALAAIPYKLAGWAGGDLLERLQAIRLLGALLCGLTVLFAFSFIRDLLPGTRLAAPAGALVVAFQPMFGFIGSGVNADALLFTVSAALFALLARSLRFGPTPRRMILIGALVAAGMLTKLTFAGVVPGALLGVMVLLARMPRHELRRTLAAGVAAFAAPLVAYGLITKVAWDRAIFAPAGTNSVNTGLTPTGTGRISYLLQFYFPRLPFLEDMIPGKFPVYTIWFKQLVGRFGWLDYSFAPMVTTVALAVWAALSVLIVRALALSRGALASRRAELATYVTMTAGLLVVIAFPAYDYLVSTTFTFEQIRYLFPLLALYGALVGLAVRGAGPRWGPAVAASAVSLAIVHTGAALLLTIGRYYS